MAVIIIIIIKMIIAILLFLGILKIVNKLIFKNQKKINWKQIIIGWCVVFGINVFAIITNIPIVIGIPYSPFFDGGLIKYYVSLGYVVKVEKELIIVPGEKYGYEFEMMDEKVKEVEFLLINKK